MGDPIKVGDRFYDYNTIKEYTINNYCKNLSGSIHDVRALGMGNTDMYNISAPYTGGSCIAQGQRHGKNAEIFSDWRDGNSSIYSTEYKPAGHVNPKNSDNVNFTTIYDWGYNYQSKEYFYYKAIDKNGNNIIDEGEITKYNNQYELFDGN